MVCMDIVTVLSRSLFEMKRPFRSEDLSQMCHIDMNHEVECIVGIRVCIYTSKTNVREHLFSVNLCMRENYVWAINPFWTPHKFLCAYTFNQRTDQLHCMYLSVYQQLQCSVE